MIRNIAIVLVCILFIPLIPILWILGALLYNFDCSQE